MQLAHYYSRLLTLLTEFHNTWNVVGFPTSVKKEYLYWVISAKRSTSRHERIQAVVALARSNQPSRYP